MIRMSVNIDDLLKWSAMAGAVSQKSPGIVAGALNAYGELVARNAAMTVADKTGLDVNAVAELIAVKPATPDDLRWEMNLMAVRPPPPGWTRPWERRVEQQFQQDQLVKIVTVGDERVCPICRDLEEHSPYTLADAEAKLPAHPNCRCAVVSWNAGKRTLPVTIGRVGAAPPALFTGRQLGQIVAWDLRSALRVRT